MNRRIASVASLYFIKRAKYPRIWVILISMVIYLDITLGDMPGFLQAFDVRISLWGLLTMLLSDPQTHCVLLILFSLWICDLPGWDDNEPYVLLRSGRFAWILGRALCVLAISVLYWVAVLCITGVLAQRVALSNEWGAALRTLAETSASEVHRVHISFSSKVMAAYTPVQGFTISILLNLGFCVACGLISMVINFMTGRPVGAILVIAFALLDRAIGGLMISEFFYHFSPASLSSLEVLGKGYVATRPTLQYAVTCYALGIFIPLIAIALAGNRLSVKTLST